MTRVYNETVELFCRWRESAIKAGIKGRELRRELLKAKKREEKHDKTNDEE